MGKSGFRYQLFLFRKSIWLLTIRMVLIQLLISHSTLISGPGGYGLNRVMGGENSSNLVNSSNFNDGGTYKNGSATSSSAILPMPGSILRLTSSTPKSENRWLLYNNANNDRGWVGGIGEVIVYHLRLPLQIELL